jgi:hypothetical protein
MGSGLEPTYLYKSAMRNSGLAIDCNRLSTIGPQPLTARMTDEWRWISTEDAKAIVLAAGIRSGEIGGQTAQLSQVNVARRPCAAQIPVISRIHYYSVTGH